MTKLRIGRVPDAYLAARWDVVRSAAVAKWCEQIHARTHRRSDEAPMRSALAGHGLLIMGPVGTGKSSAAALACRAAALAERDVLWAYVPEMVSRMSTGPRERADIIRAQSGVDLLVWDDFGVTDLADWEVGYLDQIVEARYRNRKPMVVTTNWTPNDLRGDARLARLVDRLGERTASQAVVLSGTSMRTNP